MSTSGEARDRPVVGLDCSYGLYFPADRLGPVLLEISGPILGDAPVELLDPRSGRSRLRAVLLTSVCSGSSSVCVFRWTQLSEPAWGRLLAASTQPA